MKRKGKDTECVWPLEPGKRFLIIWEPLSVASSHDTSGKTSFAV